MVKNVLDRTAHTAALRLKEITVFRILRRLRGTQTVRTTVGSKQ